MGKSSYEIFKHEQLVSSMISRKFERLVVVKFHSVKPKSGSTFECVCVCGGIIIVSASNLKRGNTKSCGCLRKENARCDKPGDSGFGKLYDKYRGSARLRGLCFELTKEQLKTLTQQNCHYCGIEPLQKSTIKGKYKSLSAEAVEYSTYKYNGIDRVNNKEGYTLTNCLPCCIMCNKAKRDVGYDDFIRYLDRIKNHRNSTV